MSPIFIKRYRSGGGIKLDYPDAYGMVIDNNIDDPEQMITYIGKNAGYRPCKNVFEKGYYQYTDYGDWKDAFFMPRPCYVAPNGSVLMYSKRDDVTKQENGADTEFLTATTADRFGVRGNMMVEFPKIFYKVHHDLETDKGYVFIADRRLDKDFVCYANIDADDHEIDHFYMAMFESFLDTSISNKWTWRSKANANVKSYPSTYAQAILRDYTYALNNNEGDSKIWLPGLYCDRVLIDYLLLLIAKTTDLQAAFGSGYGVTTSAGINNKVYKNAAQSYRTADTSSYKKSLGLFGASNGCVRVFGIENYWGNASERIWGKYTNGNALVKMTYGTYDGSTVIGYENSGNKNYGQGFVDTGFYNNPPYAPGYTTGDCIMRMYFSPLGMFPKAKGDYGYNSVGFCDAFYGGSGAYYKPSGLFTQSSRLLEFGPMCRCNGNGEIISARLSCKPYAA